MKKNIKEVLIDGKAIDVKKTKTVWSLAGPTPVWLGKFIFYWSILIGVVVIGMPYFSAYIPVKTGAFIKDFLLFSVPALAFLKKALGLKEK